MGTYGNMWEHIGNYGKIWKKWDNMETYGKMRFDTFQKNSFFLVCIGSSQCNGLNLRELLRENHGKLIKVILELHVCIYHVQTLLCTSHRLAVIVYYIMTPRPIQTHSCKAQELMAHIYIHHSPVWQNNVARTHTRTHTHTRVFFYAQHHFMI